MYGAIDIGQSKQGSACSGIAAGFSCTETDTAFRLGAGYRFNSSVSMEASYSDFGASKAVGAVLGSPRSGSVKLTGFQIAAVAELPINDVLSITGKVGVATTKLNQSASGVGTLPSSSATSNTGVLGIGMRYKFSPNGSVRVNYEDLGNIHNSTNTSSVKLTLLSAGVVWDF